MWSELDACLTGDQELMGLIPTGSSTIHSCRLIRKFSMDILSVPLFQDGQLSGPGKRMCISVGNCLEE